MSDLHPVLSRRTGRHHRQYFRRTRATWAFAAAGAIAAKSAVLVLLHLAAVKQASR